jgi:diguanylate cyclase (GGDEF)-like protein
MNDDPGIRAQELESAQLAIVTAQATAPMATFLLDVEREVTELTPALRKLWGLAPDATHARLSEFLERVYPDDRQRVADARSAAMRTMQPYSFEYRMIRPGGEIRIIRTQGQFFYDAQAGAMRNVGVVVDITDHLRAASEVRRLIGLDRLTGLLDRSSFSELVVEIASRPEPPQFAIVAFDLLDFRRINESHGTAVGDDVLRAIARRLLSTARNGEYFARLGGDEFAALLHVSESNALEAVARIESILSQPIEVSGVPVTCEAEFGVSVSPADGADEFLIVKASLAMAQARQGGAAGAQRYRPEMERLIAERRLMQMTLRGALERDEFEIYLQPIVDAKTRAVQGAEALLRWNHPTFGVVPPNVFLPAAEDAGLMKDVDLWVLRHGCDTAAEMLEHGVYVGLNLTAHLLLSAELPSAVEEVLRVPGVAERLWIEITEQTLLADRAQAQSAIALMRSAGVRIALDDFGTGYNTLGYLKICPIDAVKIDRSFVSDLEQYPYSRSVCSGVLALASELGLYVVAEGVETEGQEEFLRARGCNALQGHLYGKAMPKNEFLQFIERSKRRRKAS